MHKSNFFIIFPNTAAVFLIAKEVPAWYNSAMDWKEINVRDNALLRRFWKFSEKYFAEIIDDKEDLKYFLSAGYRRTIKKIALRKERDRIVLLAAFSEKEIAAICIYHYEYNGIFIMEYCVDKALRGRGLGGELYRKLEKLLFESGVKQVRLTPAKPDSEAFWAKHGFLPTGEYAENGEQIHIKYTGG